MTHSLHRQGTYESLQNDFVFMVDAAKGINDVDVASKGVKIIDAAIAAGCINLSDRSQSGNMLHGDIREIKENLGNSSRLRGVFTSKENLLKFLKSYKKIDPGISLVVSGLLDEVADACEKAEIIPHSINFSLGVFGNKARLAPEDILAVTTMCGHHMISPGIVERVTAEIREGKKTAQDGALELSKLCDCGLFNYVRAEKLLQDIVDK